MDTRHLVPGVFDAFDFVSPRTRVPVYSYDILPSLFLREMVGMVGFTWKDVVQMFPFP